MKKFKIDSPLRDKIFVLKYQDRYVSYDPVSNNYSTTEDIAKINFWDWQIDLSVYSLYEKKNYDIVKCKYWESQYLLTGRAPLAQKLFALIRKFVR